MTQLSPFPSLFHLLLASAADNSLQPNKVSNNHLLPLRARNITTTSTQLSNCTLRSMRRTGITALELSNFQYLWEQWPRFSCPGTQQATKYQFRYVIKHPASWKYLSILEKLDVLIGDSLVRNFTCLFDQWDFTIKLAKKLFINFTCKRKRNS